MREQLEIRLNDLKSELASGQKMLGELESKRTNLVETLLRIAGAIQVLEEELGYSNQSKNNTHRKFVSKSSKIPGFEQETASINRGTS